MKKSACSILVLIFTLALYGLVNINVIYANDVSVNVDGMAVSFERQAPRIIDNRTLAPMHGMFRILGFDVDHADWDQSARTVTLSSFEYVIVFSIGGNNFTVNGKEFTFDVPPQTIDGSIMLPIRAVLESMNYIVDWDADENTVKINSPLILLASIPERDIYVYGHPIDGNRMVIDIHLEASDRVSKWLYTRHLARSEFRLYYGNFFNDYEYHLIFIDYEHGGHGGGSEGIMVFSGEDFDEIPIRHLALPSRGEHKIIDNKYINISMGNWQFEVTLETLSWTYRHGNWFEIEDGRLIQYFYYEFSVISYTRDSVTFIPHKLLFRAEYFLYNGELSVGSLSIIDDRGYWETR